MITTDLWQTLRQTQTPIVLYGMGDGADKILALCAARGIPVRDVFASDDFVRGQLFHGKPVLTWQAAKERYGKPIVLLAFATAREDVRARILSLAEETELYVPDVPVFGDTVFDAAFYEAHRTDFDRARALLSDERSREVYDAVIEAKLTGRLSPLLRSECDKTDVDRHILRLDRYTSYADLGAYTGDTVREMLARAPHITSVTAVEADPRTFRKLAAYAAAESRADVICHACGVWDKPGTRYLIAEGNRNSNLSEKKPPARPGLKVTEIPVTTLDTLLDGRAIDYIKYDVEGAEEAALQGSAETIRRYQPDLLVSLYHRSEDLYALPLAVHALCPDHALYLRRFPYFPAWDLNLYAIRP